MEVVGIIKSFPNMIYLYAAIAQVLAVCSGFVLENSSDKIDDERYFFFAGDDDHELTLVDSKEPVDYELVQNYSSAPDNHGYWLFTRGNPLTPQVLQYEQNSTVRNSNFNNDKKTVILSHGWRGSCNSEINTMLTEAFLQTHDVNVIVFDWSGIAGRNYVTAQKGVASAGRNLGQFIRWLVTLGASYEDIHLVGYSLGGHLVGNAGRETGGKVKRITALDPAGPLWFSNPESLNKTDGQYVEVIHTTILLGHFQPCGTADFYLNGGVIQPCCVSIPCSQRRAYELMAASVKFDQFASNECRNMEELDLKKCTGQIELMGNGNLERKSPGIYRTKTGKRYPYVVDENPKYEFSDSGNSLD